MRRETLRDRLGNVSGYIDHKEDRIILRDRYLATAGYWERRTNVVRDARGHRVGTGLELLGTLTPRY